jgi:diadenosine tetraphosphate (Ap4A) HIT family hydrolase
VGRQVPAGRNERRIMIRLRQWTSRHRSPEYTVHCPPMPESKPCPFCTLPASRVISAGEHGVVVRDAYPISLGHSLIIPKRHVGSFFDLATDERTDLLRLLDAAKLVLDQEFAPQAYNIGINDGAAAGQTIPHLHIHLIPRYKGDRADPRGGVRWIIPEKADYWSPR